MEVTRDGPGWYRLALTRHYGPDAMQEGGFRLAPGELRLLLLAVDRCPELSNPRFD